METYALALDTPSTRSRLCAICGVPRITAPFHLTHGIVVQLCAVHSAADFLWRRGGTVFTRRLADLWRAHGVLNATRRAALTAHHRRTHRALAGDTDLPGSYAWPDLRDQAERRFAAGDDPRTVIDDLRAHSTSPARVPSYQTLRRWFTDARWLAPRRAATNVSAATLRIREVWPHPYLPLLLTRPDRAFQMLLDGPRRPAHHDMGRKRRAP